MAQVQAGQSWALRFGAQPSLEFKADAIAVEVAPVGQGEQPRLEIYGVDVSDLDVRVREKEDHVDVELTWRRGFFPWTGPWDARAVLHVPPALRAEVETDAGAISMRDLADCDIRLKAKAGRIGLEDVHGRLRISTDAGQVTGRRIGGWIDVRTHAGAVTLEIDRLAPGEHEVRTDVGAIRIDLARGLPVRVDTQTTIGSARSDYPTQAAPAAILRVRTEVGSIRVEEAAPSAAPEPAAAPATVQPAPTLPSEPSAAVAGRDGELRRILDMVERGELSAGAADEMLRAKGFG